MNKYIIIILFIFLLGCENTNNEVEKVLKDSYLSGIKCMELFNNKEKCIEFWDIVYEK